MMYDIKLKGTCRLAKQTNEMDMLHGSLWDKLILFAAPVALTAILEQLFNAADVAILGQYLGKDAMAAVGNSVPIVGLIVAFYLGISLGSNVIIARAIGARDFDEASSAVHSSVALAILAGILILLLGEALALPMLRALSVPEEVMPMAESYLRVFLLGMPFMSIYNFAAAILRSRGDTKTPMIALLIASILNVLLDFLFVAGLAWGVAGAAFGTALSYWVAAWMLFLALRHAQGILHVEYHRLSLNKGHLQDIFAIGMPAALQGMVFCIANLCIQAAINSLGPEAMAASAAGFIIEIIVYCFVLAFQQSCTTFVSQNYGAGNLARCKEVTQKCLLLSLFTHTAICIPVFIFTRPLLALFNPDPVIIALGVDRIHYVAILEGLGLFIDIFSGAMRGYGYSLMPAIVTLIGICGVRLLWVFFVFPQDPSFVRLLLAYPLSWSITSFCIYLLYRFFMRHVKKPMSLREV